ncbi:MAG: hypothetical protein R3C19_06465 [Planctomycetaceae bacterium]
MLSLHDFARIREISEQKAADAREMAVVVLTCETGRAILLLQSGDLHRLCDLRLSDAETAGTDGFPFSGIPHEWKASSFAATVFRARPGDLSEISIPKKNALSSV